MQVDELKEYLLNNDLVENVLSALGCGHVRNHGDYISASNPDGDNKNAITLYINENLNCIDYKLSKLYVLLYNLFHHYILLNLFVVVYI